MSIREDKINNGDTGSGCLILVTICFIVGLPVIAALVALVAIAIKAMME